MKILVIYGYSTGILGKKEGTKEVTGGIRNKPPLTKQLSFDNILPMRKTKTNIMEMQTLPELLKTLKRNGFTVDPQTIRFYQRIKLLPMPIKKSNGRGSGVTGYYNSGLVLTVFKSVLEFKSKGLTLEQIQKLIRTEMINKFNAALKQYGFSNWHLPELSEMSADDIAESREFLKEIARETLKTMPEFSDNVSSLADHICNNDDELFFEKKMQDLYFFFPDEVYELKAVMHIVDTVDSQILGLNTAQTILLKDAEKKDKVDFLPAARRILKKIIELEIIKADCAARAAEILEQNPDLIKGSKGKFLNQSKEQWKNKSKQWEEISAKGEKAIVA